MGVVPLLRISALGLATWAIPFAISFLFVEPGGRLLVPEPLFKSLMVVISGGLGAALLVVVFRGMVPTPANGLLVGTFWRQGRMPRACLNVNTP